MTLVGNVDIKQVIYAQKYVSEFLCYADPDDQIEFKSLFRHFLYTVRYISQLINRSTTIIVRLVLYDTKPL